MGEYTSLAVVNGKPAISYADSGNDDLKYARATDADGTTWGTPARVDGRDPEALRVGTHTSLAIVNGQPAISYSQETDNANLRNVRAVTGTVMWTAVEGMSRSLLISARADGSFEHQ